MRLREPLEQALGVPVFLEYDGHTAVLGEWWQGAGRGYQNVVFSIIGTGIGGGMIVNGTLYRGRNRLAGAAGWFTLSTTLDDIDEARNWALAVAPIAVVLVLMVGRRWGAARAGIAGWLAARPGGWCARLSPVRYRPPSASWRWWRWL